MCLHPRGEHLPGSSYIALGGSESRHARFSVGEDTVLEHGQGTIATSLLGENQKLREVK